MTTWISMCTEVKVKREKVMAVCLLVAEKLGPA
jgi:hypothetical protein